MRERLRRVGSTEERVAWAFASRSRAAREAVLQWKEKGVGGGVKVFGSFFEGVEES